METALRTIRWSPFTRQQTARLSRCQGPTDCVHMRVHADQLYLCLGRLSSGPRASVLTNLACHSQTRTIRRVYEQTQPRSGYPKVFRVWTDRRSPILGQRISHNRFVDIFHVCRKTTPHARCRLVHRLSILPGLGWHAGRDPGASRPTTSLRGDAPDEVRWREFTHDDVPRNDVIGPWHRLNPPSADLRRSDQKKREE